MYLFTNSLNVQLCLIHSIIKLAFNIQIFNGHLIIQLAQNLTENSNENNIQFKKYNEHLKNKNWSYGFLFNMSSAYKIIKFHKVLAIIYIEKDI